MIGRISVLWITLALCLALLSGVYASAQEDDELFLPELEVITTENVERLQEIAALGRGTANTLDWHPSGATLAAGTPTGIWLLDDTLQIITTTPVDQPIVHVAWSPDGSHLAAVSDLRDRCTVQIWDAEFTEAQIVLEICGEYTRWNADGTYLAVFDPFSGSNEVQIIDLSTNEVVVLPGQDGAWSPSGDRLFTRLRTTQTYFEEPPMIYVWNVRNAQAVLELNITDSSNETIVMSEIVDGLDETTLLLKCRAIAEDADRYEVGLCILDIESGAISRLNDIMSYPSGQAVHLTALAWNTDNTLLASVNERFSSGFLDFIYVFDTETNEIANIGNLVAFDWRPESDMLTAIVGNGELRTYNAATGDIPAESHHFTAPINMIAVHPNSSQIASTGFGYQQNTYVWDLDTSLIDPALSFYAEPAEIVHYTPDGSELIAGGTILTDIVANRQIDAFDPETGERLRNIDSFYAQGETPPSNAWNASYTDTLSLPGSIEEPPGRFLSHISWSPDYSTVAVVEQSMQDIDFRVSTWNVMTGELINYFSGGMDGFTGLVWSPDGTQIAVLLGRLTGGGIRLQAVQVFSVVEGENYEFGRSDYEINTWGDYRITQQTLKIAWNSEGSMLAVVLPDLLEIHSLTGDMEALASLPAYAIVDLEWSADDRFIAAGSEDGTIRLWGVPTRE